MSKTVIILGGGISGMSAAHELVERGFNVKVYETRDIPGGKARSMPVPDSGKDGRKPLPGEHGFRFFPSFYRHVTDTMKRIPYKNNPQGVYNNLAETTRLELACFDKPGLVVISKFPHSLSDLIVILKDIFTIQDYGLTEDDIEFFATRVWQLFTSCKERRLAEYEKIAWWDYIGAEGRSIAYQNLLAKGITTSLVASRAQLASTRTMGDILIQLLLDIISYKRGSVSSDLVLNGPTNDVWIQPWLDYLTEKKVDYNFQNVVQKINCENGEITGITILNKTTNITTEITGDYYISAVPVEIIGGLINDDLIKADRTLGNIKKLSISTAWMNGIQFYLKEDVPIVPGHVLYVDTPWALTSISQKQFWKNFDFSQYGDGNVKGILSVIPSNWGFFVDPNTGEYQPIPDANGILINKPANECTPEEIKDEVWAELKRSLNVGGKEVIKDDNLHSWFLDPDISNAKNVGINNIIDQFLPPALQDLYKWILTQGEVTLGAISTYLNQDEGEARIMVDLLIGKGFIEQINTIGELRYQARLQLNENVNAEPLLVNLVNTWQWRPSVFTRIPNLFLAGDYVRTNTDLATMEGANESARRAVNAIIDISGENVSYCKIWDLYEPWILGLWRWSDRQRFKKGLPWSENIPWFLQLLQQILIFFYNIIGKFKSMLKRR